MRDPVTGFEYPIEWTAKVEDRAWLPFVENGLAVLDSSGHIRRRGFSTGTTAAAACKAAVLSLNGPVDKVHLTLPCGIGTDVPVVANEGAASCRKYPGDCDDDPTTGAEFIAEALPGGEGVIILPGEGIGEQIAGKGISSRSPAVSPSALGSIMVAVRQAMEETRLTGVRIELRVVDGEKIALRTINARSGIGGGIAVLGTTGLVEPWEEHAEEGRLDKAAAGNVVLTTGRIGLHFAHLYYPGQEVVLVGNSMRQALESVSGRTVVFGLPGNICRAVLPVLLEECGKESFDELALADEWPSVVQRVGEAYRSLNSDVEVRLIDRNGRTIGVSP